ncbi:hypothetical protein BHYA_0052g00370 [Botrytis hyacinthi]|uniref:Uncharacterized protein n=1 Tax=Botrytis hyacinthi TaxID=278943 RepID=A0A4Z1GT68_9HELO|nr:hypothetical protein BHYA_0052g00370 [Botrytis hyacinthi]
MQEKNTERGEALEEEQRIDNFLLVLARLTESSIPDNNFDITSVASILSAVSATPIKSKVKKPKVEKAEKVKAPTKNKAPAKEKAPSKDKEDRKEVKDFEIKGAVKEAKEAKLLCKDEKEKVEAVIGDEVQEVLMEYLIGGIRPFSVGDVSEVTKTLNNKLLKELVNSSINNGKGANKIRSDL